jgi:hypothetical protein
MVQPNLVVAVWWTGGAFQVSWEWLAHRARTRLLPVKPLVTRPLREIAPIRASTCITLCRKWWRRSVISAGQSAIT